MELEGCITSSRDPIPNQFNPTSILRSVFSNIHFNIVLFMHIYSMLSNFRKYFSRHCIRISYYYTYYPNPISQTPWCFFFCWTHFHRRIFTKGTHFTPTRSSFPIRTTFHSPLHKHYTFWSQPLLTPLPSLVSSSVFGSDTVHSTPFSYSLTLCFTGTNRQTYETKKKRDKSINSYIWSDPITAAIWEGAWLIIRQMRQRLSRSTAV
jgi:hypothetical protein